MADNGSYYAGFDDAMRDTFRRLCSRADVITPNITEAALLAGEDYRPAPHGRGYIERIFEGLAALGPRVIAVTGVHPGGGEIGTVVLEREERQALFRHAPGARRRPSTARATSSPPPSPRCSRAEPPSPPRWRPPAPWWRTA